MQTDRLYTDEHVRHIRNPVETKCTEVNGAVQCTTTGGQVQGGQIFTFDVHENTREEYYGRYLADRGFNLTRLPILQTSPV